MTAAITREALRERARSFVVTRSVVALQAANLTPGEVALEVDRLADEFDAVLALLREAEPVTDATAYMAGAAAQRAWDCEALALTPRTAKDAAVYLAGFVLVTPPAAAPAPEAARPFDTNTAHEETVARIREREARAAARPALTPLSDAERESRHPVHPSIAMDRLHGAAARPVPVERDAVEQAEAGIARMGAWVRGEVPVPVEREWRVSDALLADLRTADPSDWNTNSMAAHLVVDLLDARAALRDAVRERDEARRQASTFAGVLADKAEAEAECCPEDVGAAEYIHALAARLTAAEAQLSVTHQALDAAGTALFSRCGGVPPATDEERAVLDQCAVLLGWYGSKSATAAIAAAHDARIRASAIEAAATRVHEHGAQYRTGCGEHMALVACERDVRALVPPTSTEVKE